MTSDDKTSHWADNLESGELAHWRAWFSEDRFREQREARRSALDRGFPGEIVASLGAAPGQVFRVLDVGSGPISTMPTRAPRNPVELVCIDALGEAYNALLDEFGYTDCLRIRPGKGEQLTQAFGESTFHWVNIANALDHCEDPARTLAEMYAVCRPGGQIVVISFENEGEWEAYSGLHQWNLEASDDGLRLWNRTMSRNLTSELPGHTDYSWRYRDGPDAGDHRVFRVVIRKP